MAEKTMIDEIQSYGLIPVIAIEDPTQAEALAKALCDGGLPAAEVTFRTAGAKEAIARMTRAYPDMLVGAGTVLTTKQVDEAVEAGARFIVSPGLNPKVVSYCLERNIPILPGCATPSDMETALELGLKVVKFFPAEANGGIKSIRAMAAPYTQLRFMPTGGINEKNLLDYLSFPKIIACGGSFMVPGNLLKAGDFEQITELTRNAVRLMHGFAVDHVGVYAGNEAEVSKAAARLSALFGISDSTVRLLENNGSDKRGYIAVSVNNLSRAAAYFERLGLTLTEKALGSRTALWLNEELCGFELCIVEK